MGAAYTRIQKVVVWLDLVPMTAGIAFNRSYLALYRLLFFLMRGGDSGIQRCFQHFLTPSATMVGKLSTIGKLCVAAPLLLDAATALPLLDTSSLSFSFPRILSYLTHFLSMRANQ